MSDKLLCSLRQDLREANQRYHKIAVTTGRLRKALERIAVEAPVDAEFAHAAPKAIAREALKRNDGFAVRYEEALKVAKPIIKWVADMDASCLADDEMDFVYEARTAINKINSILGGK